MFALKQTARYLHKSHADLTAQQNYAIMVLSMFDLHSQQKSALAAFIYQDWRKHAHHFVHSVNGNCIEIKSSTWPSHIVLSVFNESPHGEKWIGVIDNVVLRSEFITDLVNEMVFNELTDSERINRLIRQLGYASE